MRMVLIFALIWSSVSAAAADFITGELKVNCRFESSTFLRQYTIQILELKMGEKSLPLVEVNKTFPEKEFYRGVADVWNDNSGKFQSLILGEIKLHFRDGKISGITVGDKYCQ